MRALLATLAWISCGLASGPCCAEDRPLVDHLPKGMPVEKVMQIARATLASRGWVVSSTQTSAIDAQDGKSRILLSIGSESIRYTDLVDAPPEFWQRGLYPAAQQKFMPVPAERIAELRVHLVAALGDAASSANNGQLLLGNLPASLTNDQVLRVVWSALSGRRWTVKTSSSDTVVAEYANSVIEGKLTVFIVGRELRYTDQGTKQRTSGLEASLPDNWIANLRADTSRGLLRMTAGERPAGQAAPPSARMTAERLRTLKELHESGAITRDEYEKKRAEILKDL